MRFSNRIVLRTPESVEIEFQLAGIGNRAYALAIDYIILGLIITVVLLFATLFLSKIPEFGTAFQNRAGLWTVAILALALFAIYAGYFVFFEAIWQGQTPGKRFVKIRVVGNDGRPVGLAQSTLRGLLRAADEFFWLGMFFIIFRHDEKRLGDLVAGTVVIQEEVNTERLFLTSSEAEELASQLLLEGDFSQMLPQDFGVLREYLNRRSSMLDKARREVSKKLAFQLKDIIKLPDIPEGVRADVFLEAVYLAYQRR